MNFVPLLLKKRRKIFSVFRLDIAVTYKCNSKCIFCNVWKIYNANPSLRKKEMKLKDFKKLFSEVNLSWLHLTGGEPFMRNDFKFIAYYGWILSKPFILDIASNGQLTNKIKKDLLWVSKKIRAKIEIGISLDGDRETYKKIRGIDGFEKAIKTFETIKNMRLHNVHAHFNYIISPLNVGKLKSFIELMKEKGIDPADVSVDVARNAYIFHNLSEKIYLEERRLINEIKIAIKNYKKHDVRNILRKIYLQKMIEWIKYKKRPPCYGGFYHYFIDPYGNLRPCQQCIYSFGNIKEGFWKTVNSSKAIEWRKTHPDCRKCWTGCEGITSLFFPFPIKI